MPRFIARIIPNARQQRGCFLRTAMLAILVGAPLQSASALEHARAPGAFLDSAPFDVPVRYFAWSSLLNPFEIMQSVRFTAPPDRYKTRIGWLIASMQAHMPTLTSTGRVPDHQLQGIGVEMIQSELAQVPDLPNEEYLVFMLNIAADVSMLEVVNARRGMWDRVLSLGRNAAAAMASDFIGGALSSFGRCSPIQLNVGKREG